MAAKLVKKIKQPKFLIPAAVLGVLLALGLVVELTPVAEYATPEEVVKMVKTFTHQPFASVMMVGVIVLATALLVPLSVMTLATAMAFGPFEGILISLSGAMISASLGYGLGNLLGEHGLRRYVGPTLKKIRGHLENGGIAGLIALRFVPVAPYTAMNVTLGILEIPFITFITASFLELLPGCAIRAFLGGAISELWRNPEPKSLAIVAAALAVWALMVLGIHMGVHRWKKKHGHAARHHKLAHS